MRHIGPIRAAGRVNRELNRCIKVGQQRLEAAAFSGLAMAWTPERVETRLTGIPWWTIAVIEQIADERETRAA